MVRKYIAAGYQSETNTHFICPQFLFQYDKLQHSLAQHGWRRLPPGGQSEEGQPFLYIEQAKKAATAIWKYGIDKLLL